MKWETDPLKEMRQITRDRERVLVLSIGDEEECFRVVILEDI